MLTCCLAEVVSQPLDGRGAVQGHYHGVRIRCTPRPADPWRHSLSSPARIHPKVRRPCIDRTRLDKIDVTSFLSIKVQWACSDLYIEQSSNCCAVSGQLHTSTCPRTRPNSRRWRHGRPILRALTLERRPWSVPPSRKSGWTCSPSPSSRMGFGSYIRSK